MAKRDVPPIHTDGIRLRLVEEADLETIRTWRNRDENRRWFGFSGIITLERHRQWWDNYKGRDDDFLFIIEDASGEPAGQVGIYDIDYPKGTAELGRSLSVTSERGVMHKGSKAAIRFAFEKLGLTRLWAKVKPNNLVALAYCMTLGFVKFDRTDHYVMLELAAERFFDENDTQ